MRCVRCRKWISDDLDGVLAPRRKSVLARHEAACPGCRAYRWALTAIQAGALAAVRAADRTDAYWRDFGARLESRLRDEPAPRPAPARAARLVRRPWVWGGAGLAAGAALAAYFVVVRPRPQPGPLVFTFEDTVASILDEIGDNPELERSFNRALQASIVEAVREDGEGALRPISDDPLVWEGLTEEEIVRIESRRPEDKRS
jgi:hypothetical protein